MVTAEGGRRPGRAPRPATPVTTSDHLYVGAAGTSGHRRSGPPPSGVGGQNVVIPIDLVAQRAGRPIAIPGQGGTHAIVVLPGGHTVLAASGNTVVPVDVATRRVGRPLDLGAGRTIFGMALDPVSATVYVLVAGGVVPVDTVGRHRRGHHPHRPGRVVGLLAPRDRRHRGREHRLRGGAGPTRLRRPGAAHRRRHRCPRATPASFDNYGISDPAALAVEPDGSALLVVDSANNWVNPVPVASFANPPTPVRLPPQRAGAPASGTEHPTDIVLGPAGLRRLRRGGLRRRAALRSRRPRPSAGPSRCAPAPRPWPWPRRPDRPGSPAASRG